ncbi:MULTISPECIES: hypothetical protein [unclassified Bradyrhizobium]
MKDIPIIFSGPMVRALLAGRKTMTRRIFTFSKEPPPRWDGRFGFSCLTPARHVELRGLDLEKGPLSRFIPVKCWNGDRLWVRETVACGACALSPPSTWAPGFWRREQGSAENPNGLWYAADNLAPAKPITERGKWVPAIHMPRWASRLTLIVTGVKVERLQDISERDALAEGVHHVGGKFESCYVVEGAGVMSGTTAAECFRRLWESLHGAEAWDKNPFVAAISFSVIKANIDQSGLFHGRAA